MWVDLKQITVVTSFVMAIATGANADEKYDKCMDAAETNADFGDCGDAFVKREDAKLNATWKELHGAATGQTKKDLLAEQRLWVSFKESACKFYANGDWGREGQVIDAPACMATIIADRTEELKSYAEMVAEE